MKVRRRLQEIVEGTATMMGAEAELTLHALSPAVVNDEATTEVVQAAARTVLGEEAQRRLYDHHARLALSQRVGATPVTARFYIEEEERYLQAMLDYIMVSPDLRRLKPEWRIWHPFDDPVCYRTPELRQALLTASDHFPVSIDIDLPA